LYSKSPGEKRGHISLSQGESFGLPHCYFKFVDPLEPKEQKKSGKEDDGYDPSGGKSIPKATLVKKNRGEAHPRNALSGGGFHAQLPRVRHLHLNETTGVRWRYIAIAPTKGDCVHERLEWAGGGSKRFSGVKT
jgi:hypothetical protein